MSSARSRNGLTLSTLPPGSAPRPKPPSSPLRRTVADEAEQIALRAHPVRTAGDRDRHLHPPRICITRAESEQAPGAAGRRLQPARCSASSRCTRESEQLRAQAADDLAVGARHARQDQRSRRRRRAVGGRDARGRADRRRPDQGDRGRPQRGRGRRRRRHPRRRPGRARRSRSARRCPPMSRRSNRSSA